MRQFWRFAGLNHESYAGAQQGGATGAKFPGRRITAGAPKSPKTVICTSYSAANVLPKELRFEHGGAKLASSLWRHLISLRP